ncbi:MAG: hypothetical protein II577_03290 [Erysipelotrichaceae bacterium]|nr:hypothetical protein [Erysipelotrichaceae bacterium]
MYQDYKDKKWIVVLILIAISGLFLLGRFFLSDRTRSDVGEESVSAISEAVKRTALQCYVIEGAYPEDLQYLQDNYGLQVNTDDYVVVYRAFADNRVPDIRVVKKEQ